MNAQTQPGPFTGHHRKVFDCIRREVERVERYCRSDSCIGHPQGFSRATYCCEHSATLILGMSYPYAGEDALLQDRQIVAFADFASAYVRTLWFDTVGAIGLDAQATQTRQRYRAELARLTGNSTASAGKSQTDWVEAA